MLCTFLVLYGTFSMDEIEFHNFDICLAGIVLPAAFRYEEAALLFGSYCLGPSKEPAGIRIPAYELETWLELGNKPGPRFEFSCLTAVASDYLSAFDRFIMHAVAFRWRDRAFLISAPSGTGKSTLLRTLQEYRKDDFSVICGDRPILFLKPDGSLWVCPSPWNGKENWYGAPAAPLGGTILLHRSDHNELKALKPAACIPQIYNALIQTREEDEIIRRFARFCTALIRSAPVWQLDSREAIESVPLLLENLFSPEESS